MSTDPNISFKLIAQILFLWLAGIGAAAQFAKIAIPFDQIRLLYPDFGSQVGWLLSVISVMGVVFGMVAGVAVARYGPTRLLVWGLVVGSGLSLWQSTLPGFVPFLFSRLLEGASHLIITVAAPILIVYLSPNGLRRISMTLWSTFFGVSFALMAWLAFPLIKAFGLSGLFWTHGLFLLVMALILMVLLRGVEISKVKSARIFDLKALVGQHRASYSSPFIGAPAIGWLFYTFTYVSLLAILPEMVAAEDRFFVSFWMPLASIIVALFVVGPLLIRVSAVTIVICGFLAASVAVIMLIGFSGSTTLCITLFAILGLIQAASFAAIPQLNPDLGDQSLANGAMAQMGNLGNVLGTPVLLSVRELGGASAMLSLIAVIYVLGAGGQIMLLAGRQRAVR